MSVYLEFELLLFQSPFPFFALVLLHDISFLHAKRHY